MLNRTVSSLNPTSEEMSKTNKRRSQLRRAAILLRGIINYHSGFRIESYVSLNPTLIDVIRKERTFQENLRLSKVTKKC